jgi:hypothetical protein
MSFYKQNLIAFIHIMEQHHDLFSKHKDALTDLLENLPKDAEQISRAIDAWCENHHEIYKIQTQTINECKGTLHSGKTRGPFGTLPSSSPDDKKLREKLLNAIRRVASSSQPQDKPNEPIRKKSD